MALASHVATLGDLFGNGLFVHASVQRDFQWTEKECEELVDDLYRAFSLTPSGASMADPDAADEELEPEDDVDAGATKLELTDRPYYLGTVVLGDPDAEDRRPVFDGLQRLTALTILIAVVRDLLGQSELSERLHRAIIKPPNLARMRLPVRDGSLHDEVQVRGATQRALNRPPATDMGLRIRSARALFKRKLHSWPVEQKTAFAEFLLERSAFTVLEVKDAFLAIRIFMSTNTRGKPLRRSDVLKGQIIELVAQESGAEAAERAATQWSSFQKRLGDDLEMYIRCVAFMSDGRDRGIDFVGGLFQHLQETKGASAFVGQLGNALNAWDALNHYRDARRPLSKIDAAILRMSLIPWHEWKPLALAILKEFGASAEALLVKLERMTVAIELADLARARRSTLYAKALTALRHGRGANWTPYRITKDRRARLVSVLQDTALEPREARPIIVWLDALKAGGQAPAYLAEGTLEHVLPCNPDESWNVNFPTPELRQTCAQQIGNMAWVDEASNVELGALGLPLKQSIIRRKKLHQRYALIGDVLRERNWSPESVAARTKTLANVVLNYLGQPGL